MATLKDAVLYHLEYTFEKEAWQPSLAMAVDGLRAAQAAWKSAPPRHSVWQIVRHVIRWKQATFDDWHGRKPNYEEVERGDWQEVSGTDEAWQADVQGLHAISREFMEWVQSLSEEDLARPVAGDDMALGIRLIRMATHDTYHAGQIRYVRALQGA
jgi:hypothetical protein